MKLQLLLASVFLVACSHSENAPSSISSLMDFTKYTSGTWCFYDPVFAIAYKLVPSSDGQTYLQYSRGTSEVSWPQNPTGKGIITYAQKSYSDTGKLYYAADFIGGDPGEVIEFFKTSGETADGTIAVSRIMSGFGASQMATATRNCSQYATN